MISNNKSNIIIYEANLYKIKTGFKNSQPAWSKIRYEARTGRTFFRRNGIKFYIDEII